MRGLRYLIDKQGAPPPSPPPSCSRRMATMLAYVAICREGCGLMHASNNLTSGGRGAGGGDILWSRQTGLCTYQKTRHMCTAASLACDATIYHYGALRNAGPRGLDLNARVGGGGGGGGGHANAAQRCPPTRSRTRRGQRSRAGRRAPPLRRPPMRQQAPHPRARPSRRPPGTSTWRSWSC